MQGQILCANPLVAVYDDVFDAAACDALITLGTEGQKRAQVMTALSATQSENRTNTQSVIDQWSDPIATEVCTRISALVRIPPENCESAKILRYEGDQQFKQHVDAYSPILPASGEQLSHGGQRLFTTLCYLNEVEGGETEFPALKISVKPKPGRVLLFSNTIPGTIEVHPHSAHAGRPVESGVKWVMSLWWREHIYHVPRSYPAEEGETQVF